MGIKLKTYKSIVKLNRAYSLKITSYTSQSLYSKIEHCKCSLPSVSKATARFWKMSIWAEWAMVLMLGVRLLLWMNCIACVPTYRTKAFISWMLYRVPGSLDCNQRQQTLSFKPRTQHPQKVDNTVKHSFYKIYLQVTSQVWYKCYGRPRFQVWIQIL